jgi:hypothetical protein
VKFKDYDYRVGAMNASSGREQRVPYTHPSTSGGGSLGPDSMRQHTVSYAQHTEVLSNASIANYNGGSMNYRVGDSLVYQTPSPAKDGSFTPIDGSSGGGGHGHARGRPTSISTKHPQGGGSQLYASLVGSGSPVATPKAPHVEPAEHPPGAVLGGARRDASSGPRIQLIAVAGSPDGVSLNVSPDHQLASPQNHALGVISPAQPKSILKAPSRRSSAGPQPPVSNNSPRLVQVAASRRNSAIPYAVPDGGGLSPGSSEPRGSP